LLRWDVVTLMVALVLVSSARAADEPDVIFKRSTVFKWLTPNSSFPEAGLCRSVAAACRSRSRLRPWHSSIV
jgi:hypothetical protein